MSNVSNLSATVGAGGGSHGAAVPIRAALPLLTTTAAPFTQSLGSSGNTSNSNTSISNTYVSDVGKDNSSAMLDGGGGGSSSDGLLSAFDPLREAEGDSERRAGDKGCGSGSMCRASMVRSMGGVDCGSGSMFRASM